jgi:ubiquinone/menaquinone biosynthesis C-methylase UbiE
MSLTVQESYDKIAQYFSVTRVFTWNWTDNFIELLNNNSVILDIGSGNGRNTNYKNHAIYGIDISMEQLKMNKSNNCNDIHGNMINLPFKYNTFDAILSIASFHHLSTVNERHECLKEMKRVLTKNGKILMSIWSINQPKKTKRKFNSYGDTIVNWNTNRKDETGKYIIIPRYYYIFKLNEINELLKQYFKIDKYYWDSGNEIFELSNN